jgi:DNA-directed RNA polymerase specialized sigma24 family protein
MVIFQMSAALNNKDSMEATVTMLDIKIPKEREQLFTQLYEEAFPKVAKFVANRGGSFEDARDIFHDALVILYERITGNDVAIETSQEYYLIGISKHLWMRKFKDDKRKTGLGEMENTITIPEDFFEASENRLTSLLQLTGKKCLELLRAFYYDNLSLQQIKSAFGFSTLHSASVQKFKCIEKMRTTIQEKSIGYEDLR